MKKTAVVLLLATGLYACKDKKAPDVSGISINLTVQRYEQDFFGADTNRLPVALHEMAGKYGGFTNDFANHILGIGSQDAGVAPADPIAAMKRFINDYRPIKDSADKLFKDFSPYEQEIRKGLQYVRYYFPAYRLPEKVITFVGPMDASFDAALGKYGDVITPDGLAIGLQLHLGSNFSMYQSEMGQQLYPTYISRRFSPEYIPVNCMKNIIDDIYPEKGGSLDLVSLMIEKGKRLHTLEMFLPYTADSLLTGFTAKQLKFCDANEAAIWNFFLTNSLLYKTEPDLIREYVSDAPFTQAMGKNSPGFVGMWVGRQIIRKYLSKHPDLTLQQLLQTDPRKIFEESKYKPG